MASVDAQILSVCSNISSNIDSLASDRGLLAQNILSQLRNLVEALAVRLHQGDGRQEFSYDLVDDAISWVGSGKKHISFLYRFHRLIQMSASHYTFEGDASERLMLKYYEYLLRIKTLVQQHCGVTVLHNLSSFPVDLDPSLREYYEKIAAKISTVRRPGRDVRKSRYYIHKVRPFFTDERIYYEVTFSRAINKVSKFDRSIAFTDIDINGRYATSLSIISDSIQVLNHTMPILLIQDCEVSIRPCELENFAKVLGRSIKVPSHSREYRALMHFLTVTEGNLLDLVDSSDENYHRIRDRLIQDSKSPAFLPCLDAARKLIRSRAPGSNLLRYLMLEMNNRIIKLQYQPFECRHLSNLCLSAGCKPFDDMPFCTSPRQHNPRFSDLTECLDMSGRAHELLARKVRNNVESEGMLYTPKADLAIFGEVEKLVSDYNKRLYYKHTGRHLVIAMDHVFLQDYEDGTTAIIEKLREFAVSGVAGYQASVAQWLQQTQFNIDDQTKKDALQRLFTKSRVALIYGAAGTGKSTMVNFIANYFNDQRKLILAHTNPAIDNLQRKVSAQKTEFRTISSQKSRGGPQEFDVLIIDECSTVCNADFLKVLERTSFKLLVLVGDVFQIESIQFGNWFKIVRSFLPSESVFELVKPFRTHNRALLDFWTKVRNLDDGIEESIAHNGYAARLDESLFKCDQQDEIILCLNYDGLYGINNVNRFLQSGNKGKAIDWGVATYKIGDPVLFNDIERFKPFIYNNLKGWITNIVVLTDRIRFDVKLERKVTDVDVDGVDLRYVDDSTVQFDVLQPSGTDDDDDAINTVIPFQVAYAVSIHKAQGLEYDSVKVVITKANEEDISHNIFYTAVTRTRNKLKIFWSPESQLAVLNSLERKKSGKDVELLRARKGW